MDIVPAEPVPFRLSIAGGRFEGGARVRRDVAQVITFVPRFADATKSRSARESVQDAFRTVWTDELHKDI